MRIWASSMRVSPDPGVLGASVMALASLRSEAAPLLLVTSWAPCALLLYSVGHPLGAVPPLLETEYYSCCGHSLLHRDSFRSGGLSPLQPQCCGHTQRAGWPVTAPTPPEQSLVLVLIGCSVIQKWFDKVESGDVCWNAWERGVLLRSPGCESGADGPISPPRRRISPRMKPT